jgi:hypothetical protein
MFGLAYGLMYSVAFGATTLLFGEAVEPRSRPNQATRRSAKVAITGILAGLCVGIIDAVIPHPYPVELRARIGVLLIQWSQLGPIYALFCGGFFSLRHFMLRIDALG